MRGEGFLTKGARLPDLRKDAKTQSRKADMNHEQEGTEETEEDRCNVKRLKRYNGEEIHAKALGREYSYPWSHDHGHDRQGIARIALNFEGISE